MIDTLVLFERSCDQTKEHMIHSVAVTKKGAQLRLPRYAILNAIAPNKSFPDKSFYNLVNQLSNKEANNVCFLGFFYIKNVRVLYGVGSVNFEFSSNGWALVSSHAFYKDDVEFIMASKFNIIRINMMSNVYMYRILYLPVHPCMGSIEEIVRKEHTSIVISASYLWLNGFPHAVVTTID